jgi:hypothetical protein
MPNRSITPLANRLASIAAIELARHQHQRSDRFIREDMLYPELASGVSIIKWQPSAEVPVVRAKSGGRGDVKRADLKFWRIGRGANCEVLVEVKLMKAGLPASPRAWQSAFAGLRKRLELVDSHKPRGRTRVTLGMIVGTLPSRAAHALTCATCTCVLQSAGLKQLHCAAVDAEYKTWAAVYGLDMPRAQRR